MLEKLVGQFSKEVGLDKANVLIMLLGEDNLRKITMMSQSSIPHDSSP
jgi:hypothetical protein